MTARGEHTPRLKSEPVLAQIETLGYGGVLGRRRLLPVAAELTDGLLLEAVAPAAAADGAVEGPLENVKRWMQELQYPEQVRCRSS